MKCYSSLKSKKERDKDCKIVRRKGRVYVINKKNPKLKARQGQSERIFFRKFETVGYVSAVLFFFCACS